MLEVKRKKNDGISYQKNVPTKVKPVNTQAIQAAAKDRASERNVFKKILDFFKPEKIFCELVVNGMFATKRIALLKNGILQAFETDGPSTQQTVGAIFMGRIQNLEPGLRAAFVDIGQEKNAFLHYWDVLPLMNGEAYQDNKDDGIEIICKNTQRVPKKRFTIDDVQEKFPIGTNLLVQVVKSQIGTKGPRVTTNLSLPGRYLVLTPFSSQCGISRKIEGSRERNRLKKLLRKLELPDGMGVIFRTISREATLKQLLRDMQFLLETWQRIQGAAMQAQSPCKLYQEPDLLERTVRDFLTDDIDRVLVDNAADYQSMLQWLQSIAPNLQKKIQHYQDTIPIFERYNVEPQIEQMFSVRVPLPSGGEIVIQETEAMTSVDVNTSSHRTSDDQSAQFIFQANVEAAREMVRQVRLRNIGGIIIVDFVDMEQPKSRQLLFDFVKKEFESDRARTQVFPINQLGLMAISRQRHTESLHCQWYTDCPYCNGEGKLKSLGNLALQLQRELVSQMQSKRRKSCAFTITLHPHLRTYLKEHYGQDLANLVAPYGATLHFEEDPNRHIENFSIVGSK